MRLQQQYAGAPMKPPRDCCYDKVSRQTNGAAHYESLCTWCMINTVIVEMYKRHQELRGCAQLMHICVVGCVLAAQLSPLLEYAFQGTTLSGAPSV